MHKSNFSPSDRGITLVFERHRRYKVQFDGNRTVAYASISV